MDSIEIETGTIEESTVASTIELIEVSRTLFLAGSVEDSLARAVDLSVVAIEACEFASVFLLEDDEVKTRAFTDPIVVSVDALQLRTSEGPGLDAIVHGLTFYADELGTDARWPHFGPEAAAMGMRSLLALPIATDLTVGSLSLYARYPQAFGVIDRARGLLLASMAGLACWSRAPTRTRSVPRTYMQPWSREN